MNPRELLPKLLRDIDRFYQEGQKDPGPVLEDLKEVLAAELPFRVLLPSKDQASPYGDWLRALPNPEGEDRDLMTLSAMIGSVRETEGCPGILLFPGPRPVFLTPDLYPLLLSREEAAAGQEPDSQSVRTLLDRGRAFRDPDGSFDPAASLDCFKRAYELARADRASAEYVEACLCLAEYHPGIYEEEELKGLLEEAILLAGLLVNEGRREGPDLLIRAKRLQEQAGERGNGRMRYMRSLPPSFFEF